MVWCGDREKGWVMWCGVVWRQGEGVGDVVWRQGEGVGDVVWRQVGTRTFCAIFFKQNRRLCLRSIMPAQ